MKTDHSGGQSFQEEKIKIKREREKKKVEGRKRGGRKRRKYESVLNPFIGDYLTDEMDSHKHLMANYSLCILFTFSQKHSRYIQRKERKKEKRREK